MSSEQSIAQQLLQKHAEDPHHVTVEDVPDEELTSNLAKDGSASWVASATSNSAGKKKETLDTQSHEVFPELGSSKGKSANVAPIWGAKSGVNGKNHGAAATTNGTSHSSPSASGTTTPSKAATPSMIIPGRNVETVTLEPQFILPRGQLKRPIPDILKDINRKSRATITMATAPNGRLRFDATGPQEVAQQALKDLVQQIGTRVSNSISNCFLIRDALI